MSTSPQIKQISETIQTTLSDPLSTTLLSLDKSLASQTQTSPPQFLPWLTSSSAQLNIAHKTLDELAAYAQSRLDGARGSFKKGLSEAKELQKELGELERRVRKVKDKVRERWPVEYYTVRDEMDG